MQTKKIYNENFFYTKILKYSKEDLSYIISRKESYYSTISIPKHSGIRQLCCIEENSSLYNVQKNLSANFLNNIPLSNNTFGFVKGYSYRDFLEPHINNTKSQRYYLRLDINDFFGSVKSDLLRSVLSYYIKTDKEEVDDQIISYIVELITLNGTLPQGAITSPVVSNIIFRQLDVRIQEYCYKLDIVYSRYADDLLFSSFNRKLLNDFFIGMISRIIRSKGFTLNYSKIKRERGQISLNGFVVGNNIRISRKKKEDITRILHLFYEGGKPSDVAEYLNRINNQQYNNFNRQFLNVSDLLNYLCGYRSFLIQWLPKELNGYMYCQLKSLIDRVQKVIIGIEKLQGAK
ncbi:MAG: reverse transcriptase family protein [Clostridia bacterium]|nr:reverse transcriptase family protein [Clostridia bacterium]